MTELFSNKQHQFQPGQLVSLKADPSVKGAVMSISPGETEDRVIVFMNGVTNTYYSSQLSLNDKTDVVEQVSCDEFHAFLSALQIKDPNLSTLYSLNSARIDFIPFQFRPVLRFIRSDRPRLLIADGVGVGKTIEAGLILRELQSRTDINSVLIICPRPLVTEKKWLREMKRFDEHFTQLDGPTLRFCTEEYDLEGMWPEQHQKAILPFSLLDESLLYGVSKKGKGKKKIGLFDLDPIPRFDLVIVDEAHHVRNPNTYSHKAVRYFCDNAEAVVFLTATPIQLGGNDLYNLLNMLRPDLILDQQSFERMAEPNTYINEAINTIRSHALDWKIKALKSLDEVIATSWGEAIIKDNPKFISLKIRLDKEDISPEDRIKMISELEELHTFSGIINRTRRRDIGKFSIRKPETVMIPFTSSQQLIHDELLSIQSEILSKIHGDQSINFMMTTIRRQAASSLFGLKPYLEDILSRRLDELLLEDTNGEDFLQNDTVAKIKDKIKDLILVTENLDDTDPKLEALQNILKEKQELVNNKVMVFSSFRHTLRYLNDNLSNLGFRVGIVHGGTPDHERVSLKNDFEKDRGDKDCIDVLLFSEIGCEGLDYQFCDCIVNYDLPWNPMRVEQRIGRIDRNGQKSESVAIVNLITPGTVDADIFERCLDRIGVFNRAIGGSELILGEITIGIKSIAENYNLTDLERKDRLQQLSDNKIRLIQEYEELEEKQVDLFGINIPQDKMKQEIEDASSFWLTPGSIYRLVDTFLKSLIGEGHESILGENEQHTLRVSVEHRKLLLEGFHSLKKKNHPIYRNWENWLKSDSQYLPVTFDAKCASSDPMLTFINPLHPLVKQAEIHFSQKKNILSYIQADSDIVPEGEYLFCIYQWKFTGLKEDLILKNVSSCPVLSEHIDSLFQKAKTLEDNKSIKTVLSEYDTIEKEHYKEWQQVKLDHIQRNIEIAKYKKESLFTSHEARMKLLSEQLNNATDSKIVRMRNSQIESAKLDLERRVEELDDSCEKADVIASPIVYGLIRITRGSE